jgi:DNA modification methylase
MTTPLSTASTARLNTPDPQTRPQSATLTKSGPGSNSSLRPPLSLQIQYRPIAELKLDPNNPRIHAKKQVRQIARSIETFGFNVPVLIDGANKVIAGHGRILACRELGWTEAPTIRLDHLTAAQANAYMIADNRLTEISLWDDRLLAQQFKDLLAVDLDFSLEVTGFEMGEIDMRIEGLDITPAAADNPADKLPPPGPAVSEAGDLWLLGSHRLLCGNALDEADFAQLMNGAKAEMVFIDPPYNVKIDGHVSGLGSIHHREFAMASGEMSPSEFTDFLTKACVKLAHNSAEGSIHFICMDWRHTGELLAAGNSVYSELKNICVWVKDNAGMGSLYRSQHELVFVFKHGTGRHRNNVQLGQYGRHRSNVWRYAGINSFGRTTEEGNLLELHPTVKPTALVADAILDCSARGGIILDTFMGSGTTLMAAERTGRIAYGMEFDPLYIDVAIRRWQAMTGEVARHALTGRSFTEVAAERGKSDVRG